MLTNTRPPVMTERVLTCWTKYVGEEMPDRIATRKLMVSVRVPRAADQLKGSGRANPKAISSDSIPHRSAARQKATCASSSGAPLMLHWACERRRFSPTEERLQWKRSRVSSMGAVLGGTRHGLGPGIRM